jgi:hypothetical protein
MSRASNVAKSSFRAMLQLTEITAPQAAITCVANTDVPPAGNSDRTVEVKG